MYADRNDHQFSDYSGRVRCGARPPGRHPPFLQGGLRRRSRRPAPDHHHAGHGLVIHQDQLKIREGLGKDGRDAGAQKTLCLIYRHDDADLRLFFMLFLHNKLLIASGRFLPSFRPFAA